VSSKKNNNVRIIQIQNKRALGLLLSRHFRRQLN